MLVHTYVYTIICHNIRGSQELQHFATKPKTLTSNVTKFEEGEEKKKKKTPILCSIRYSNIYLCNSVLSYRPIL